ncbi:undecaprenyl-phosphate glucose phosphotransferase [Lachnoclostridium phytofermentans]|uniref:Undecaprenyl-phosphate glucose phosphotransferase n=1 Tax=Lachnoclostridium phytofermentans (strain ATCC 700394 / DSM 18823 / ISDg) TaxID=357809 RepID=A9KIM8_LACP7|nr:undecaprenyl-phosphate glucose phosphotransferase [Lachnoclostridium phytofermentans]ABX43891.1 Undecaprenyl-phosphate glucose phosphotransferase [Lachnoclostridium phytofermentans ISDg]
MIKDNQKILNRIHIIIDGILIILAFISAYSLRFHLLKGMPFFEIEDSEKFYELYKLLPYLYILVPAYLIIYSSCNMYKPQRSNSKRIMVWNLVKANFIGILVFISILWLTKELDVSRKFSATFMTVSVLYGALFRFILAKILSEMRRKGFNQKHVLIVGYSRAAEGYIDRLAGNPDWGYHIYGILDDIMEVGTTYKKVKVIGTTDELQTILEENDLDEIAVTLSINEYAKLEYLVGVCEKAGAHTKFVPDYHNIIPTIPVMEDLDGLPVINIRNVPLNNSFNSIVKRLVDVFGAIVALILFSIPMAIVAIIIKCTSPGPLIYSQVRVGLHNKEFKMYKFRSMVVQTEKSEKKAWTTANDNRVTPIGRFIRKTSIDELPQLFNILCGDMSLVGPRPERPYFVEKFKEEIPRYMIKHQVRPGLTGWAQINGFRGDTSIRKRIECDLYYIENWTLGLDFKILFLTIFKGFINKNAY